VTGREWQPGDLVSALVQSRPGRRIHLAFTGTEVHPWTALDSAGGTLADCIVSDARPLTVIDFDLWPGQESGPRAAELLRLAAEDSTGERHLLLAWLADQIDPGPPKPDEPTGLGAVVEDDQGHVWTRADESGMPWVSRHSGDIHWCRWADVAAFEVLSEGVQL
jgi:hypothetical protein